jgi:hypothetical protein
MLLSFLSEARSLNEEHAIASTLDQFHQAAGEANAKDYLNLLTDNAVFLGTDSNERWTKKQFTAFVLPYFDKGSGWLYLVQKRHISLLDNNSIAFFDETLENSNYGICRGSGVLIKTAKGWKISQYNLSLMVPNGIAKKVVEEIKNHEHKK